MKKIVALGLAAAGVFWALRNKGGKPVDHWAAASDKV